ncbi:MAG: hypothetical protein U0002_20950 [Thermoanaerobaculia bacterium]
MRRLTLVLLLTLSLASFEARPTLAGGNEGGLDFTTETPPVPGYVVSNVVPRKWDTACMPVTFRLNSTIDPIPNPLGAGYVTVADALGAVRRAAKAWTDIPTSFLAYNVAGTVANTGSPRFDQVNEITFRYNLNQFPPHPRVTESIDFGSILFIRGTVILDEFEFTDGLDIDGDGDSDVSSAITTCQDVDGDGDIEFPAKLYPAATILDTDIELSSGTNFPVPGPDGFRFTVADNEIDTDPRSVDLQAVLTQAFGTTAFFAHNLINQPSDHDGLPSPMYPSVDTGDPASEWAMRYLDLDAITNASFYYPEGTATSGPAALQRGDVAFDRAFGLVKGKITHGPTGLPGIGASVFAVDRRSDRMVATTISGNVKWLSQPNGFNPTFVGPDFHIVDSNYTLVLPPGDYYIGVEAIDEIPVGHAFADVKAIVAFNLNLNNGHEDFYDGPGESALERRPSRRVPVHVRAGHTTDGIDITINKTIDIANFGLFDKLGFAEAAPGTYYAVRIAKQQFLDADASAGGHAIVQSAEFLTGVADGSVVPRYAEAMLATGEVGPDGTAVIDVDHPLAEEHRFVGQDFDFTPLYFENSVGLAERIRRGMARGRIQDLFLVLKVPNRAHFPGVSDTPPLIGLDGGRPDNDVPIYGDSFTSTNGKDWTVSSDYNFMFQLVMSEDPG